MRLSHLIPSLKQFRNLAIEDLKKTSPHKMIFVAAASESIYRINVILMYPLLLVFLVTTTWKTK